MIGKPLAIGVAVAFLGIAPAASQTVEATDDAACQEIGAQRGTVDYRECRLLLTESRTGDPYMSAMARAGLLQIQHNIFYKLRQQEEAPDFSVYGRPEAPAPGAPRPSFGCVTIGDGMGGGITDCD